MNISSSGSKKMVLATITDASFMCHVRMGNKTNRRVLHGRKKETCVSPDLLKPV